MRTNEELKNTSNSSVYKKAYKAIECLKTGKCTLCPWHNKENGSGIYKKFGTRKPKKKQRSREKPELWPDDDIKYVMGRFDMSDE